MSWGGRLTLINSVLASIPSYFMTCFRWPKESIHKLEGLLRSFLWQGTNTAKGGQCLVAWHFVTITRSAGGLGVRDLSAHNQALLTKFTAWVLQHSNVPCYQWFAQQYCHNTLPRRNCVRDTAIWNGFKQSITMILASSKCSLGSGRLISF